MEVWTISLQHLSQAGVSPFLKFVWSSSTLQTLAVSRGYYCYTELITPREGNNTERKPFEDSSWAKGSCTGATFSYGLTGNSWASHVSCQSNCQSTKVWLPSLHDGAPRAAHTYQGPATLKRLLLLHYHKGTIAVLPKTHVNSCSLLNYMYPQTGVIQVGSDYVKIKWWQPDRAALWHVVVPQ